MNIIRIKVK